MWSQCIQENPFEEGSDALLNIGSGEYADQSVVISMKELEQRGKEQYTKYWDDVIKKGDCNRSTTEKTFFLYLNVRN